MKENPLYKKLYQGILLLQNEEECEAFLKDLCSIKELEDLSARFEVVKLVDKGIPYAEISKQTGASTATICRVAKSLNYGSDGYRLILDRLKETEKED